MKNKSLSGLVLALSAFIVASCSNQQAVTQPTPTKVVVTPTAQSTVTVIPTETPTITPTPKKAENFEDCETTIYESAENHWGYDDIKVLHENSYLVLETDGIRTIISESEIISGMTYFTVNGVKLSVTSGTVLFLDLYTKDTKDTSTDNSEFYITVYSPESNGLVEQTHLGYVVPPYVYINIFKDSTITVPTYQEGYCVEQLKYFYNDYPDEERKQCAIVELPSGDQYGWGVNKYGEIVCPSISIVEQ